MITEGKYTAGVVSIKEGPAAHTGSPCKVFSFKIAEGADMDEVVHVRRYITPKTVDNVKRDCETCGYMGSDTVMEIGRLVRLHIVNEEYEGKARYAIKSIYPLTSGNGGDYAATMRSTDELLGYASAEPKPEPEDRGDDPETENADAPF
jgi:hypothetical protein